MAEKNLLIKISGEGLDEETINQRTQTLYSMLQDNLTDGTAAYPELNNIPAPGAKGDVVTIGTIIVTLITSGALTALIGCLKAVFAGDDKINIDITKPDGTVIKINASNIKDKRTQDILGKI
jgi:hypothetical protein